MREHVDGDFPLANEFNAAVAAHAGTGVKTGCLASKGAGDLDVDVAAGTILVAGAAAAVTEDTVTVDAGGAFDRYDLVVVGSDDVVDVVKGTVELVAPSIPANHVLLAIVFVEASASSIAAGDILDARVIRLTAGKGLVWWQADDAVLPASGGAGLLVIDGVVPEYNVLAFDAAADEVAYVKRPMPADYDGGQFTLRLYWHATATTGTVKWVVSGRRVPAGSAIYGAGLTQIAAADGTPDPGAADSLAVTTAAGVSLTSLAANELLFLQIKRDADDAGDTMAGDAKLIAVALEYTRG